jgi:hypothetical protein
MLLDGEENADRFVLRIYQVHVYNNRVALRIDRQFCVRRNRMLNLRERRAVLCRLTAKTNGKWKRIICEKAIRKSCEDSEKKGRSFIGTGWCPLLRRNTRPE